MAIVPNSNVNLANNVRDVLNGSGGSVSNDLTSFFKDAAKIRMWAAYKPFIMAKDFPTDSERSGVQGSGLSVNYSNRGIFNIASFQYNLPTGGASAPMRLGDFRGYNSEAKVALEGAFILDAASNTMVNGYRDINSDYAEVYLKVTFPDIYPGVVPPTTLADGGTMEIVEYQGNNRVTLHLWDFADAESELVWNDHKNQTHEITVRRTYNLPSDGEVSSPFDLYLMVNGGEVAKCSGNIIGSGWLQNPGAESQWKYATVTDAIDTELKPYVYYTAIQYLEAKKSSDLRYVRIKNFFLSVATRWTLYIDARDNSSSSWVNIFNIDSVSFTQGLTTGAKYPGGKEYVTAFNYYTHPTVGYQRCLDMSMQITTSSITDLPCTEYRIRVEAGL